MSTTGERIRELRHKNRMTLDDVASHLGIGKQAVYKYEQGAVTNIPLENLEKMAELFGTTPGYLAGWSAEVPPPEEPPSVPHTPEARILAIGIDKMPQAQREAIINMMQGLYPGLFEKGNENNES